MRRPNLANTPFSSVTSTVAEQNDWVYLQPGSEMGMRSFSIPSGLPMPTSNAALAQHVQQQQPMVYQAVSHGTQYWQDTPGAYAHPRSYHS